MTETDAVIIGAGPVGLFQVFELGLLEINAHVIDSLPAPGGQCIELYPDKPIYDIPALPASSGRELVARLLEQIKPFAPTFHLGQVVTTLQAEPDGRWRVETDRGTRLRAKVVIVAAGVGAFLPRSLKLDGLTRYLDRQVFHQIPEPRAFAGQRLVIVGGDESALDAALRLAAEAHVTLVHRRDAFSAEPETIDRFRAAQRDERLAFVAGQAIGIDQADDGRLTGLVIVDSEGEQRSLPLDMLLVRLGLSPKLGPLANWGLALERKQVVVDTANFESSVPGIYAVGDINTYPGKRKLIVCGFHEATLAAFSAAARVFPDRPVQLQYTTTSPRLHQLLGVAGVPPDPA